MKLTPCIRDRNGQLNTVLNAKKMLQEDWKRAINKAIENVTPPERGLTDHTLAMSNSEPGATCCACGRLMKGLFYQGYQCSVCKLYAHRACIADMPKCGAAPQPQHSESKSILKLLDTFTVEVHTQVALSDLCNDSRKRIVPPDLPTRPVSMLVPAATTTICSDDQLLQRQRSTRSLVVTSSGGVTNQQIIGEFLNTYVFLGWFFCGSINGGSQNRVRFTSFCCFTCLKREKFQIASCF